MAAGPTYEPIATNTLGSNQSSVTFSSFSGYTDLVLVSSPVSTTGSNTYMWLRYNSDNGSNYSLTSLRGNASTVGGTRVGTATVDYMCYSQEVPTTVGRTTVITQIMNYSNSTTHKTILTRNNDFSLIVESLVSRWANTNAITSITIGMDASGSPIATGSTFTLYGIKAA
jgi:hypothetical protein